MAAEELRHKLFSGEDPRELLWDAVVACQNQTFYTTSGLPFSYTVRRKKDGGYSGELLVSRKEGSKTLTRSSVQLALERVARDYAAAGEPPYYSGPKGHRADFRHLLHLQPVLALGPDSGSGEGVAEYGRRIAVKMHKRGEKSDPFFSGRGTDRLRKGLHFDGFVV